MNMFSDLIPGGANTHFPLNPVATPGGGTTGAPLQPHPLRAPVVPHPATGTTGSPLSAVNQFANSAGMQFAQQQSANAINNLYAAHGSLQSGAAMKAISDRAQQIGLQDYFMPYMGFLGQQQSVGAGAASSIAGVGSSFGNTAANINNNLGSNSAGINGQMAGYIGNGADAASNAAIARGAAGATLGSGIASGLGTIGSSFFTPSSYGAPTSGGYNVGTGTTNYFAGHPFGGY